MPFGFGSIKDIAKAVRGPAWLLAAGVALGGVLWGVSLLLCGN